MVQLLEPWGDHELPDPIDLPRPAREELLEAIYAARLVRTEDREGTSKLEERLATLPQRTRDAWRRQRFAYGLFPEAHMRVHTIGCGERSRTRSAEYLVEVLNAALRTAEDLVRVDGAFPGVSEGWVSDINLFRLLRTTFPDTDIVHHGSPPWLTRSTLTSTSRGRR